MKVNIMVAVPGKKSTVSLTALQNWEPFTGLTDKLEAEHKEAYAELINRKEKEINKNIYISLN